MLILKAHCKLQSANVSLNSASKPRVTQVAVIRSSQVGLDYHGQLARSGLLHNVSWLSTNKVLKVHKTESASRVDRIKRHNLVRYIAIWNTLQS